MASPYRLRVLTGAAALMLSAACSTDLDITNPNNPDVGRALKSPEDVVQIAQSSINSWYLTSTHYEPFVMFAVTSDVLTMNFGNFGARFNNLEPRIAYNNSSAAGDGLVASRYWDSNYRGLGAANDAMGAFKAGVALKDDAAGTEAARHIAMFTQAASLTNLALAFDSAFVVDEDTTAAIGGGKLPQLQRYSVVSAAALAKWDALIAATAGKSHTYGPAIIPVQGGFNSTRMNRLANTYAALLMAYTPRTTAEANAVDWAKVAAYAAKGIGTGTAGAPFDLTILTDNDRWYSYLLLYGDYPAWMRVDMRVLNMMDPSQPAKYAGTVPPKATGDNRINTDLRYMGSATERAEIGTATRDTVIGDPARGIYMMSPYQHKRYEFHAWHSATYATGAVPYILAAESDLVRAEALVRTNTDLATAAALINNTRVTRGGRTAASATDSQDTLLEYIRYERMIELMVTNNWDLFRHRATPAGKIGALQSGTVKHLPVPAKELEILGKPLYTYGSPGKEM
jgi:starch-binding outer membrane protein, SusD/RagB family